MVIPPEPAWPERSAGLVNRGIGIDLRISHRAVSTTVPTAPEVTVIITLYPQHVTWAILLFEASGRRFWVAMC